MMAFSGLNTGEAALRDPKHPQHRSGHREGFYAAALVLLLAVVLFNTVGMSWISLFWRVFVSLGAAAFAGVAVARWIARGMNTRDATWQQQYRQDREAEKNRLIAEMKAREAQK
ncbi:MAG: hypothetical protein AAFP68_11030 [Pseudomonadota bacterium]